MVTSGGVSQGDYDVVKEALSPLGTVWFGQVAMQPGKPQGFGVVGEDETPIFTLPGNPVSSYISFETFVLPALRRMMGRCPTAGRTTRGPADQGVLVTGRATPVRAARRTTRAASTPVGGHGSHLIGDLATANALIVVPEDTTSVLGGRPGAGAAPGR